MGRKVSGESVLPTHHREVSLPLERLRRHVLVLGASGSAKTETLLRLPWATARVSDWAVFFLDAKGDADYAPLPRADGRHGPRGPPLPARAPPIARERRSAASCSELAHAARPRARTLNPASIELVKRGSWVRIPSSACRAAASARGARRSPPCPKSARRASTSRARLSRPPHGNRSAEPRSVF